MLVENPPSAQHDATWGSIRSLPSVKRPPPATTAADSRNRGRGASLLLLAGVVFGSSGPLCSGTAFAQEAKAASLPPKKPGSAKVDKSIPEPVRDAKKDPTPEDRALRGVVVIERGGQSLALGAALLGDGRILTALSPLGPGNDLDARFADGTTAKIRLGHHDRAWDLALLVPQSGKWQEGLAASAREPVRPDANIHGFSITRSKVTPAPITLRSHRTLLGGDDKPIENAIELGSRVAPGDLGMPLIDEEGQVVAVVGRGCAPNERRPCTPVAFGAPIASIKAFLRAVPPAAVPPAPWLGIQGVSETSGVAKGVRILTVAPQSPAEDAHLKGGDKTASDIILAVDGVPVTSPEALADAIRAHGVGDKVPTMLFSQGKYREVVVTLRAAPDAHGAATSPANPAELPTSTDASNPAQTPAPAKKPPTSKPKR